jgi:hypothetical protein
MNAPYTLLPDADFALALEGHDDKSAAARTQLSIREGLKPAAAEAIARADNNATLALGADADRAAMDLLEQIPAILGRAAAIAYAANREFPAPGPMRSFHLPLAEYGPFGRLAHMLTILDWPEGARPSWAPKNPGTEALREPVPGIKDMIKQVRAGIES